MKLLITNDGSHTLMVEELNETYHSRHGAIQESKHVFIKNGFLHILGKHPGALIRIFELGMGTGLNALLTALESEKLAVQVEYTSIEPFPIPKNIIDQLNYHNIINNPSAKDYFDRIHSQSWDKLKNIHQFFKFRKIHTTIQEYSCSEKYFQMVFYDAFAPSKQPEIWRKEILNKVYNFLGGKS